MPTPVLLDRPTNLFIHLYKICLILLHAYLPSILNFALQHLVTVVYESHSLPLSGKSKIANSFLLSVHLKQFSFNYFQQRLSDVSQS